MFFSLNKKILLTIFTFFLLIAGIFGTILNHWIEEQTNTRYSQLLKNNQYIINLLNENIILHKTLTEAKVPAPQENLYTLSQKQEELSAQKKIYDKIKSNYNENYEKFKENLKIIGFSFCLMFLSLFLLWLLLQHWIISPITDLTELSISVANSNFSKRLSLKKKKFSDEFNILEHTINLMLNNIEDKIIEIKNKEIFLQNLIDTLPDAIRVIDEDHNIILSNKAYNSFIRHKYLNKSIKCFNAYKENAELPCSNKEYLCPLEQLKKSSSNLKTIHNIKDHPFFINSAKLTIDNKYHIIESIRDLSENINYSHQQKVASLGLLATSIAHEMKNNLGAINLILDGLLQKYYSDEKNNSEEKKYLNLISSQLKESIKVPERLLNLSKDNATSKAHFNINDGISDILSFLDYEIKSKGITLTTEYSNTNDFISGNETDFKMIILNLIQNALKAMPNGGNLNIATSSFKDTHTIQITDTGCGISSKDLPHIFEPFYSSAQKKSSQGSGLGLAIVKNLLSNLHATITVSSQVDKGSCFEIKIPKNKSQKKLVK